MKNLKRALSFALASVMVIGMMVVGAGAAFTDADEIVNDDAVNTLVALNVLNGKGDGSYFDPTATVTRGEMAKMITVALNGGKAPVIGTKATPTYTDIKGHWAEAFIEYCSNLGVIAGKGDGTFAPDAVVTGTEAAKMMLVAMGYEPTIFEFTGANWALNVNTQANKADLYDGLEEIDPSAGMSRDNAAQLVYNGILAETMEKDPNMSVTNGNITWNYKPSGESIFSEKYDGLVWVGTFTGNYETSVATEEGEIVVDGKLDTAAPDAATPNAEVPSDLDIKYVGEEVKVLFKDGKGGITAQPDDADVIYGVFVTGATKVLNVTKDDISTTYTTEGKIKVDGVEYKVTDGGVIVTNYAGAGTAVSTPKTQFEGLAAQKGDTIKFIFDADGKIKSAYVVETVLGFVTAVNSEKVTISATPAVGAIKIADHEVYEGIAKKDVVNVTKLYTGDNTLYIVEKAEVVSGTVDGYKNKEKVTLDGETYEIYGKTANMVDLTFTSSDKDFFTTGDIAETFDLYFVNGKVGAAVKTSATANNYSLVIDDNNTSPSASNFAPAKVVVLAADGTKTTLTLHKDSDDARKGDIITWTGDASSAKATIKADWDNAETTGSDPIFYNEEIKAVNGYATTADAVLFVQTNSAKAMTDNDGTFKAYAVRTLNDIDATSKSFTVVRNSAGKVVAAAIDLDAKPAGATDVKAYGIVSAFTGIVEVDDTEYGVYTIENDAETFTVKLEKGTGVLATGAIVSFEPAVDGLYADPAVFVTSFTYTGFVTEWNEEDATISLGNTWSDSTPGAYDVDTDVVYAVAEDVKVIYVDNDAEEAGDVIGVQTFDSVTGWKNVIVDVEDDKVVAVIIETSNKCNIND